MPQYSAEPLAFILRHYRIPSSMIKIVNGNSSINRSISSHFRSVDQRINHDDLKEMNRDDVEHLFKSECGFTFRDRKLFWTVLQKIVRCYDERHRCVVFRLDLAIVRHQLEQRSSDRTRRQSISTRESKRGSTCSHWISLF